MNCERNLWIAPTILSSPRANFLRAVWHWRAEIEREGKSGGGGISEKFGVKKGSRPTEEEVGGKGLSLSGANGSK